MLLFHKHKNSILKPLIVFLFIMVSPHVLAQETTNIMESPEPEKRISPGGLFVEPLLTFSREDASIKTSQLPAISDDTSGNTQGLGIGARLGVHASEMIFVGVDGRYARTKITDSAYGEADANGYNLAPTVGVQMPIAGLRVWAGYVVLGETNPEAGTKGFNVRFTEPQGPRVGLGVHLGPVSLNLEYQDLKYNKTKIESYGLISSTGESNVDYDTRGYTASLSFPMEL